MLGLRCLPLKMAAPKFKSLDGSVAFLCGTVGIPGRQSRVNYVHSTFTGGRALYMEVYYFVRST